MSAVKIMQEIGGTNSVKVQTIQLSHSVKGFVGNRKTTAPPVDWGRINSYIFGYIKINMVHVQRTLWTGTKRLPGNELFG